jgi:breast cancer 2 susceptibility protein
MPDTPTPAGPGCGRAPASTRTTSGEGCMPSFSTRFLGFNAASGNGIKQNVRPKPFKSPLLKNKASYPVSTVEGFVGSPLNPNRFHLSGSGFAPANIPHPLAAPPVTLNAMTIPSQPASSLPVGGVGFVTPLKSLGVAARNANGLRSTPAKFVTPFKTGMKPEGCGRVVPEGANKVVGSAMVISARHVARNSPSKGKERWKAFDLCKSLTRFFGVGGCSFRISSAAEPAVACIVRPRASVSRFR